MTLRKQKSLLLENGYTKKRQTLESQGVSIPYRVIDVIARSGVVNGKRIMMNRTLVDEIC